MTIKEKIQWCDRVIAQLQSRYNVVLGCGNDIIYEGEINKRQARDVLEAMWSDKMILYALDNITFDSEYTQRYSVEFYGREKCEKENDTLYKEKTQAIINILQQERDNLIRKEQEEEREAERVLQHQNIKIQIEAKRWSICAVIIAFISLLVAIFK